MYPANASKSQVTREYHILAHKHSPSLARDNLGRSAHLAIHSVLAACDNLQVILVSLTSAG